MAGGKAAARDVRLGRRGGGWIEGDPRPCPSDAPRCPRCDLPMLVGQTNGHAVCVGMDEAFAAPKRKRPTR